LAVQSKCQGVSLRPNAPRRAAHGGQVPNTRHVIQTDGQKATTVRAEASGHPTVVRERRCQRAAGCGIPDTGDAIETESHKPSAVRAERDIYDPGFVLEFGSHRLAGGDVPHARTIVRSQRQPLTVRTERDTFKPVTARSTGRLLFLQQMPG